MDPSPKNDKNLLIEYNGKRCIITPYLSLFDMTYVKAQMNNPQNVNYREMLATIIAKHTNGVFSKSDLLNLDNNTIQSYISICVKSDPILEHSFNENHSFNTSERFILAILKTSEYYDQHLNTQITSRYYSQFIEISKTITTNLKPILEATKTVGSVLNTLQETLTDTIRPLSQAFKIGFDYNRVFKKIFKTFSVLSKSIFVLNLTEEEKVQLIESYKAWGKYGWTLPPQAEPDLFSKMPQTSEKAYKLIKPYTSKQEMNYLFNKLIQMKHIKKNDINEAISCFNEKHYKACIMILFSIIDARLIRLQGKAKTNGKMRSVGTTAIITAFEPMKPKSMEMEMFKLLLQYTNVLYALYKYFQNGNDFKTQPQIANRNFIDHGMLHRKVTRRDCCMVFILLYNFTIFLNSISDNEK